MGAAASIATLNIEDEVSKPMNASDLSSSEQSVKEVARLRSLLFQANGIATENDNKFCCTLAWNFKELEKCDAWRNNFTTSEDGFPETAAAVGINVCRLYQSVDYPETVGFYEEWKDEKAQMKYAVDRFQSGFMNQWFDVDPKTYKFRNLRDVEESDVYPTPAVKGMIVKGSAKRDAKSSFSRSELFHFTEQSEADAFLEHFVNDDDGFKLLREYEGCNLVKVFKVKDSKTKIGVYHEWENQVCHDKLLTHRAETDYGNKWFGFNAETGVCGKLMHGKMEAHGWKMLMSDDKMGWV